MTDSRRGLARAEAIQRGLDDHGKQVNEYLTNHPVGKVTLYLLTRGDGSDGDEWQLLGIFSTHELAKKAKTSYERRRRLPSGVACTMRANEIEEWMLDRLEVNEALK